MLRRSINHIYDNSMHLTSSLFFLSGNVAGDFYSTELYNKKKTKEEKLSEMYNYHFRRLHSNISIWKASTASYFSDEEKKFIPLLFSLYTLFWENRTDFLFFTKFRSDLRGTSIFFSVEEYTILDIIFRTILFCI